MVQSHFVYIWTALAFLFIGAKGGKQRYMAAACSFHPLHLFLLYFCLYYSIWSLHFPRGTSLSFNFTFSQPGGHGTGDLIFQGDAQFDSERKLIELTKSNTSGSIGDSIGRVVYAQPVPLWDEVTGELTTFTAAFSFQIKASSAVFTGDGLAFFLGRYPPTDPSKNGGKNMGLFPEYPGAGPVMIRKKRAVAIEFDTFANKEIRDASSSHMGIDVNSIISQVYTNATFPGRNLTSGLPMTCEVSYDDARLLSAVLQIGDATYRVNTTVDLRQLLPSMVAVGFSAATGTAVELHEILSWSFRSTLGENQSHSQAQTPAPKNHKVLWKLLAEATVTIGVIVIMCVFVGVRRWQLYARKKRYTSLAKGVQHFAYHKLARAANNFADVNKLGEGGSASVYWGDLTFPPRLVAIKRFKQETCGQGREAFEAELSIVSRLRHRNLVELIGWCYDSQRSLFEFICWWWDDRYTRLILVYELLPEGGLDQHLHAGKSWLPWSKRYEIIVGLGSAIQYLHVECEQHQQCIVHGDIKSSNILLDSSYNAKLADFGCARFVHHETGSKTTDVVQGTYGYIDPVFINTSQRNRESDVYSFGIVLLEMVSGWDPTAINMPPLPSRVTELYQGNKIMEAADERLMIGGEGEGDCGSDRRKMEQVLLVGLLCLHQDPSSRPSIAQAMDALRSEDARFAITTPLTRRSLLLSVTASTLPLPAGPGIISFSSW